MFLGTYEHAIDEKGRITIPAKLRNQLDLAAVVTKGIDPCLWLYPPEGWEILRQKASALRVTSSTAREFRRQLFGGAQDVEIDKQGRIILPQRLRAYANIDNQAVFVGMDDHCEIWNPDSWREREEKSDLDPQWRAEHFDGLDI